MPKTPGKHKINDFFQMSDVLDELLCGIAIYGVLCQIALLLFLKGNAIYHGSGLWVGVFLALAGALHMTWSLDKALDLGQEGAVKKMRAYSLLRYGVVLIVFGTMMILNIANPLTAFLGLMGLKVAAYLQPFVHKAAVFLGIKTEPERELLSPEEVDELIRAEKGLPPRESSEGDSK